MLARRSTVLALLASAAAYGATASHGPAFAIAVTATLALAGIGFTRRSLLTQVSARGAAYLACAPLLVIAASRPGPMNIAALAGTLAALWFARPMLETAEARRAFHPARFRGLFLAGATAATTTAFGASFFAFLGVVHRSSIQIAFNLSLAAVLLVAVRALLAMRTWGLLLGGLTSLALLAVAPFYGATNAFTLTLAAGPALVWAIALVAARRSPRIRVGPEPELVRVGLVEALADPTEEETSLTRGRVGRTC